MLGNFEEECYKFKSKNAVLKNLKDSRDVMKGEWVKNCLYVPKGSIANGEVNIITKANNDQGNLWCIRLRHIRERGLKELSKQG